MNGTQKLTKITVKVVKSQRKDMSDIDYTRHAVAEAGAWGHATEFWLRGKEKDAYSVKQAVSRARLAARWALKVIGENAVPSESAWASKQRVTVIR
jgi:hypothetical protein